MFENIFRLIEGASSIAIAKEILTNAGAVIVESPKNLFHVVQGDEICLVLELWGPTILVRGIDENGSAEELVTYCAFKN